MVGLTFRLCNLSLPIGRCSLINIWNGEINEFESIWELESKLSIDLLDCESGKVLADQIWTTKQFVNLKGQAIRWNWMEAVISRLDHTKVDKAPGWYPIHWINVIVNTCTKYRVLTGHHGQNSSNHTHLLKTSKLFVHKERLVWYLRLNICLIFLFMWLCISWTDNYSLINHSASDSIFYLLSKICLITALSCDQTKDKCIENYFFFNYFITR